jgi:hypothetical protein
MPSLTLTSSDIADHAVLRDHPLKLRSTIERAAVSCSASVSVFLNGTCLPDSILV